MAMKKRIPLLDRLPKHLAARLEAARKRHERTPAEMMKTPLGLAYERWKRES